MRWIVRGADKATGESRTMTVSADNRTMAEQIAQRQGLMVEGIEPEDRPTPVELPPLFKPDNRPDYPGIILASALAGAVGIVSILLCLVLAFAAVANRSVETGMYAAGAFFSAVFYLGAKGALVALRDIARNSFR